MRFKKIKAVALAALLIVSTLAPAMVATAAPKNAANTKIDPTLAVPPAFSASQYAILNPLTAIQCGFNIQKMYNYYVQTGVYEGQRIFATPVPMQLEKVFQYMARNRKYYIEHGKDADFAYFDLSSYIIQNMELYPILGSNSDLWLYHYINFGVYEGRSCGTTIDPIKVILWNPAIAELNNPELSPDKIMENFAAIAEKFDTETLQAMLNKNGAVTSATDKSAVTPATSSSSSSSEKKEEEKKRHKIKWNLDNVKTNNKDEKITDGDSFSATLTAKDGYTIDEDSVQIKMGSKNITDDSYTASSGKIKISKVTGELKITATGKPKEPNYYTVTWDVSPANTITTSSGALDRTKPRGSSWKERLIPVAGYKISTVTMYMGGKPQSIYDPSSGYFTFDEVTGPITIKVVTEALPKRCNIEWHLTNVTSSPGAETTMTGENIEETLTPASGYTLNLDSVSVIMNNVDVTNDVWDKNNKKISITGVTGDISITAAATIGTSHSVSYAAGSGTHLKDLSVTSVVDGGELDVTLVADDDYVVDDDSVTVKMGGSTETGAYHSDTHKVTIASVTGDVEITAVGKSATPTSYTVKYADGSGTHLKSLSTTSVNAGEPLNITLVADDDYVVDDDSVSVTMGGEPQPGAYTPGEDKIAISSVTGNVEVTAVGKSATPTSYTVEYILTGIQTPTVTSVAAGGNLDVELIAEAGKNIDGSSVSVTMGGDPQAGAYNSGTHTVTITGVSGNIVIEATAN